MTSINDTVDLWLPEGEEVNCAAAGVAHHMATNHPGGGAGLDYDCDECEFCISDSTVIHGGTIRVLADEAMALPWSPAGRKPTEMPKGCEFCGHDDHRRRDCQARWDAYSDPQGIYQPRKTKKG